MPRQPLIERWRLWRYARRYEKQYVLPLLRELRRELKYDDDICKQINKETGT